MSGCRGSSGGGGVPGRRARQVFGPQGGAGAVRVKEQPRGTKFSSTSLRCPCLEVVVRPRHCRCGSQGWTLPWWEDALQREGSDVGI